MYSMTQHELGPREALDAIDRAGRRVRRERWWYVASSALMALYTAAFYIGMIAAPDTVEDFVLPGVAFVVVFAGVVGLRMRMVDRTARRIESRVIWTSVGLAVPAMLLNKFVLPEGLTPWAVLVGVLPAVPFAFLAWRVARR